MQYRQVSRVLVAVTDGMLGGEIKTELERQGQFVLGPFRSVKDTIPFSLDRQLMGAIMEDWLVDGPTTHIVDALSRRGIPVGTFSMATDPALQPGAVDVAEFCRGLVGVVTKWAVPPALQNVPSIPPRPRDGGRPLYLGMLRASLVARS